MFEVISTREFAAITVLGTIFVICLFKNKNARTCTIILLSSIFDPRAFLILDIFAIYELLLLLAVTYLPLWKNTYHKDFVFWLLLCGYPVLINNNKTDIEGFRKLIWKQFLFSTIAEFLFGLITFSLLVEYIIILFGGFLVTMDIISEKQGRPIKPLKVLIRMISITLTVMTVHKAIDDFNNYRNVETLIKLLIPLFFYISSVPYFYFFILICRYQDLFLFIANQEKKANYHSKRKKEALLWCGLNIDRVAAFRQLYPIYPSFTKEQFRLITSKKLTIEQLMNIVYPDD